MWITKTEFNVYENNLDWYIRNVCIGLVCPFNVPRVMAFSKCDYVRFMVFLANERILMCQKYCLFNKIIINIASNI